MKTKHRFNRLDLYLLAREKSHILTFELPGLTKRTSQGVRPRWPMPLECMYSRPSNNWRTMRATYRTRKRRCSSFSSLIRFKKKCNWSSNQCTYTLVHDFFTTVRLLSKNGRKAERYFSDVTSFIPTSTYVYTSSSHSTLGKQGVGRGMNDRNKTGVLFGLKKTDTTFFFLF